MPLTYLIREIDSKFYVFTVDRYGNQYDTMKHFKELEQAINFIARGVNHD